MANGVLSLTSQLPYNASFPLPANSEPELPMLWSRSLIPTMKETPEGAEIPSHVLMLRAGLINQVMAGAYTYLPLGLRALEEGRTNRSPRTWTPPARSNSSCRR